MRRFVVLPKWAAETLALWVVHTYGFELREVSTYIGIESPEKRCGKTTLLSLLSELVCRPVVAANISPPALFRVIEETRPTLLIDEADTMLHGNDELRGILNAGYSRKTAFVVRVGNGAVQSPQSPVHSRHDAVQGPRFNSDRSRAGVQSRIEEVLSPAAAAPKGALWRARQSTPKRLRGAVRSRHDAVRGPGSNSDRSRAGVQSRGSSTANKRELTRMKTGAEGRAGQKGREGEPRILKGLDDWGRERGSRLVRYSCWCPKVMAAIGRLPETLADRCIVIRMQRRLPGEECERLRNLEPEPLRARCARFVSGHEAEIARARPEIPEGLNDRAADVWEPLLAVADLAGGRWPELAREAAVALSGSVRERNPIGSLLLDILLVFVTKKQDRIFSRDVVMALNEMGDRPWKELCPRLRPVEFGRFAELRELEAELVRSGGGGPRRGATEHWLADRLRPYGVAPRTIRMGEEVGRGYAQEDFREVFPRYVGKEEVEELRRRVVGTKTEARSPRNTRNRRKGKADYGTTDNKTTDLGTGRRRGSPRNTRNTRKGRLRRARARNSH
jgi:hypothetical protein